MTPQSHDMPMTLLCTQRGTAPTPMSKWCHSGRPYRITHRPSPIRYSEIRLWLIERMGWIGICQKFRSLGSDSSNANWRKFPLEGWGWAMCYGRCDCGGDLATIASWGFWCACHCTHSCLFWQHQCDQCLGPGQAWAHQTHWRWCFLHEIAGAWLGCDAPPCAFRGSVSWFLHQGTDPGST